MSDAEKGRSIPSKGNTAVWGSVGDLLGVARFDAGDLGWLELGWTAKGLARLHFSPDDSSFPHGVSEEPLPAPIADALGRYLERDPHAFDGLALDLEGTDFQRRVWAALQRVPFGHVRSYGGIAIDVDSPRAMRAVGMANGQNPVAIVVPCHRIVEAKGRLGGYTGGVEHKVALLRHEGVRVEGDRVRPGQLTLF
ncbi:MAG: methylated-DNA--[protein]-cysteine S-methyltransferase [Deltaproteobacteria bacterium]|nr:methylated-DNA--[protein]-cysteine S-methyltransferase [Deltaproteobacteria bacterium]